MNPNVWVDLATPLSPANAVPFIDPATLTPNVDAGNLEWDDTLKFLYAINGFKTDYTISAGTGAQIINKVAGTIKIAAAGQTVILTSDKIKDANTLIIPFLLSDDATAKSVVVSARGAGSCTFKLNAAATGTVEIGFFILRNSEA